MDNIVVKLRSNADFLDRFDFPSNISRTAEIQLQREAADEIERLEDLCLYAIHALEDNRALMLPCDTAKITELQAAANRAMKREKAEVAKEER